MKYSVVVFAILIAAGPAWASKIVGNGKCAVMRDKNGYYVQKQTEIDDAGNKRLGIKIIGNGYPSEKQAVDAPPLGCKAGLLRVGRANLSTCGGSGSTGGSGSGLYSRCFGLSACRSGGSNEKGWSFVWRWCSRFITLPKLGRSM